MPQRQIKVKEFQFLVSIKLYRIRVVCLSDHLNINPLEKQFLNLDEASRECLEERTDGPN